MFDRRERAHSREGGFVATTLLHGPVVVCVPRVGQVFRELRAEVLEGRERRYGKILICRNLVLCAETPSTLVLTDCRALIMYEYVNNAPPGSRRARAQLFFLCSVASGQ